MKVRLIFITLAVIFALVLTLVAGGSAEVVGRLTQVEGRVDLLKGGNLPAIPLKVGDTVAPQDVIRTKSLSKAQITFIDNTILTMSPESRITIEEYMVDTVKGKRRAVLEIFQGLAQAVVNKIFKVKEPDFVIKTQTAVMGVRGTEIGIRILPNSTTILNFKGVTQVGNIFPEVSQLFLKAFKVAYSFGPWKPDSKRWVLLKDMQGTTVARNLPPTLPYRLSIQDRELFMRQLTACLPSPSKFCQATEPSRVTAGAPSGPLTSTTPVSGQAPGDQSTLTILNTVTVPPVVTPPAVTPSAPTPSTPSTQTYNFAQLFTGTYTKPSAYPYAVANYNSSSPGSGTRTGVYPSAFTANFSIVATATPNTFSPLSSGSFTATSTAKVSGPAGGTLTGTMQMNAATGGGTTFNLSGPVTLNPNGNLSFQTNGTFKVGGSTGTTTGTWTQTNTSSANAN
jgi:hypothetical protein